MNASDAERFDAVFGRLKAILADHEDGLHVAIDEDSGYELYSQKPYEGKELYFGGVHTRKRYVSYYLFPVYMFPDLLDEVSPELRERMQGKSCFNFTAIDDELFDEITELTAHGLTRFEEEDLL